MSVWRTGYSGTKVTKTRLYPALRKLLRDPRKSNASILDPGQRTFHGLLQKLNSALRVHTFNNMPIRLLSIPQMCLVERDKIVQHIQEKMEGIDDTRLTAMLLEVDGLSQVRLMETERLKDDLREEDVREDPLDAIFEFLFHEYGSYAILSHTWLHGTDAELTYQDTQTSGWPSTHEKQVAHQKILGFCKVAQQHGLSLGWMDTICINKDSSAELDESIRSMYQWYRNSSVCITYLRETLLTPDPCLDATLWGSTPSKQIRDKERRALSSSGMGRDRWFKRGWTLQELLAPRRMKFYDKDWNAMRPGDNDKDDPVTQDLIEKVTGIDQSDILSFDPLLTQSSIVERMIWATKRQTTRGEDRAYSLMGLFGVSLSIAYGEGSERAFFRLVEAIITSRDTSQIIQMLAWGGKPISDTIHPSRLIPSHPECYIHKQGTLEQSDDHHKHIMGDFSSKGIANTCSTFPLTREPMTLTHLGLRVRLLLVKAIVIGMSSSGTGKPIGENNDTGPFEVSLLCGVYSSSKNNPSRMERLIETTIDLDKRIPYKSNDPGTICETNGPHVFFIGIYTFMEDEEYFYLPPWYCAILLNAPFDGPEESFSMQNLSADEFEPRSKINTRNVLQLDNYQQSGFVRVKKSDNYDTMKVLTVSL